MTTAELKREPSLVLVWEGQRPLASPVRLRMGGLTRVDVGRGLARSVHTEPGTGVLDVTIPDTMMSHRHATFRADGPHWVVEDHGSKNGTFVNGLPVRYAVLEDGDLVEVGWSFFAFRSTWSFAADDPHIVSAEAWPWSVMPTLNPELERALLAAAACSDAREPVLLLGEPGSDFEAAAVGLHALGKRPGLFVPLNPPTGKPHDAVVVDGRVTLVSWAQMVAARTRAARGGTIFLNDHGELSGADLAQVVEAIETCASTTPRAWLIVGWDDRTPTGKLPRAAPTPYRVVKWPSLRERREDLGRVFSRALQQRFAPDVLGQIKFSSEASRPLLLDAWPLNLHDLEPTLAQAIASAEGGEVLRRSLPKGLGGPGKGAT